jgi:hypothetical protein
MTMQRRLAVSLLLALIMLAVFSLPALAQDDGPGKLILGGAYTLGRGETLPGGLVVAGGSATLQPGSTVLGDILVLGGSLQVSGSVNGDIAVFGGGVQLASTAQVAGDVVSFGGAVNQQPGAVVDGEVRQGGTFSLPGIGPGVPLVPDIEMGGLAPQITVDRSPGQWLLAQLLRFVQNIGLTLAFGALALIIAIVWPKGVERIGRTEMEQPLLAFAVGLLTWVLALGLMTIMAITICLIPFAMLLGLVMLAVAVLAWVATGWMLGRKLLGLFNVRTPSLVAETVVGTVVLVLAYFLVSLIFCLDFIVGVIVVSLGTGALVLTRFGRQPYVPGGRAAPPAPPAAPTGPAPVALPEPTAIVVQPSTVRSAKELGLPPEAQALADDLQRASGISGSVETPPSTSKDGPATG